MESFFGLVYILKYDFNYSHSNDLRKTIEKAINFYNTERPSFALNYKTPVQYKIEQGFV
ncbi:integrase core domain-containing protein [Carboxydothermus pertinax]|uniref:Integrase catalytic region n=1 Tax=Carboxydothermus pertinax TaxID=870242 RepID=A0A1L8CVL5_9THEO|nr:integrase catalytic region [Carboxydothermus pertinax]